MFYFSLGILILVLGLQIIRRFGGLFGSILRRFDLLKLKSGNIWEVEPPQVKVFKYIFIISIFIVFAAVFYQSFEQYRVWSQNELSKFLLPPYQSIAYFLGYSFTHFFKNYLISLVIALLFLSAAVFLNKKSQERFFEKEEPYLGALAIFLVGHPLWIYYLIAIFTVGLLGTLILHTKSIFGRSDFPKINRQYQEVRPPDIEKRFPFYHFWLPLAILVLIIGKILI